MKRANIIVSLSAALAMTAGVATAQNYLGNPGFDTGNFADWTDIQDLAGQFNNAFVENSFWESPPFSTKMWGPFTDPFAGSGVVQFVADVVLPGEAWALTGYAMTPSDDSIFLTSNFAAFKVEFYDQSGTLLGASETRPVDGAVDLGLVENTWIPDTVTKIAPPGAVSVQAVLVFVQPVPWEAGAIWFDSFQLEPVDPPTTFQNGSFDDGGTSFWDPSGFAFLSPEFNHHGDLYSLETFGENAGATQTVPALEDVRYTVRGWALTPPGDSIAGAGNLARLVVEFFEDNILLGTHEVALLDGGNPSMPEGTWVQASLSPVAPLGTTKARIGVRTTQSTSDGSVYYDDLTLANGSCFAADLNGDGAVGFTDVLSLLAGWGMCPPPPAGCPGDVDDSGDVGFSDLLFLLATYGPCP